MIVRVWVVELETNTYVHSYINTYIHYEVLAQSANQLNACLYGVLYVGTTVMQIQQDERTNENWAVEENGKNERKKEGAMPLWAIPMYWFMHRSWVQARLIDQSLTSILTHNSFAHTRTHTFAPCSICWIVISSHSAQATLIHPFRKAPLSPLSLLLPSPISRSYRFGVTLFFFWFATSPNRGCHRGRTAICNSPSPLNCTYL